MQTLCYAVCPRSPAAHMQFDNPFLNQMLLENLTTQTIRGYDNVTPNVQMHENRSSMHMWITTVFKIGYFYSALKSHWGRWFQVNQTVTLVLLYNHFTFNYALVGFP